MLEIVNPLSSENVLTILKKCGRCEVACRLARIQVLLIEQDANDQFKKTAFDMILDLNKVVTSALEAPSKQRATLLNSPLISLVMQFK